MTDPTSADSIGAAPDTVEQPVRPTVYARDLHLAENLSPEQEKMRAALARLARNTDPNASSYEYTETAETVEWIHDSVVRVLQGFAALLNAETTHRPVAIAAEQRIAAAVTATDETAENSDLIARAKAEATHRYWCANGSLATTLPGFVRPFLHGAEWASALADSPADETGARALREAADAMEAAPGPSWASPDVVRKEAQWLRDRADALAQGAATPADETEVAGVIREVREWADRRGVDIGDEDSEWWRGYRQAQRETVRDAVALADRLAASPADVDTAEVGG